MDPLIEALVQAVLSEMDKPFVSSNANALVIPTLLAWPSSVVVHQPHQAVGTPAARPDRTATDDRKSRVNLGSLPALRMRKWPIPRTGKTGRTDAGPLHDDRPSPLASAARKATLIPRAETAPVEFRGVVPFGWCRLAFAKARARLKKRRSAGLSLPGHQIALN